MPRTMLCCATLCGTVLEAAVKQAAVLAAAAAGVSTQHPVVLTQGLGALSPTDVQPVCDLVLQVILLARHRCPCGLLSFRNIVDGGPESTGSLYFGFFLFTSFPVRP